MFLFLFFFSVNNIGVSTWNKQEIIGWLQTTEICVQWYPHANFPRYVQSVTSEEGHKYALNNKGAYFLSQVYDPLLTSLDDRKTGSRMQRRKSLWRSLSPTTDETIS